ncbi:MAG TPA: ABC transporter ATP-binding protein [Sphingobacteriaceae bacterium]|nr:ABC transporter ATP-binding protein [Sphingobacteriaceae bacterium]
MAEPLLVVEDLSVHFRAVKALSHVSITVEAGQCAVLIGPNGSGKSTLIKAVAGLVRIKAGTITLAGRRMEFLPPHQRARLGVAWAPDRGRVATDMTVRDNLLAGAYLCTDRAEVRRRLENTFTMFPRLQELQHRLAGDLSGGQRQLLVMARALMAKPRLLLVDEPFTNLSPEATDEMISIINEVKSRGVGLLLAEHQLDAVLQVADKIYALGAGQLVWEGTRDQFIQEKPMGLIYFDRAASDL